MNILELSEQEINRRNSLKEIRSLGIDPYPAAEYPTNAFSTEIKTVSVEEIMAAPSERGAGRLGSSGK